MSYKPYGWEIAANIIGKAISKKDKMLVYYDPDVDGLFAGFLAQRFLEEKGTVSTAYINENRGHGFKMRESEMRAIKGWTIVAVDFAMTREEIKRVVEKGINIVVIDHHNIEDTFIYETSGEYKGVLLNNQYSFEPEEYRFLSGAGMVHCLVQTINEALGKKERDIESEAMVGITLLSDVRPTESKEAQRYLEETFKSKSRKIQYLIQLTRTRSKYESFGVPQMTRNFIDYTLAPKFNAMFRLNKGEDAIKLLKEDRVTLSMYRNGEFLDLLRDIQNEITAEIMEDLTMYELDDIVVGMVNNNKEITQIEGTTITNFIGLACSRVKSNTGKTTMLYVADNRGVLERGSVRGLYDNVDYLDVFRSEGVEAEGHKGAFGVVGLPEGGLNINSLDKKIKAREIETKTDIEERVIETSNLSLFTSGPNTEIARHNTYVRDIHRIYLRYTGPKENIKVKEYNKMVEYEIDGVVVKCFDKGLTVDEGLIQPMIDKYIEFTLRPKI